MYAFTTQTREVSLNGRSSRIDGSATFTIVVSSTIIRTPAHKTYSASQRRCVSIQPPGQRTLQNLHRDRKRRRSVAPNPIYASIPRGEGARENIAPCPSKLVVR